jgi:FKBP-type peptidyl-prolyl cis-trans isomerase
MKRMSGLKLLDEREGAGMPAKQGDCVVYNTKISLNQGDEVPLNDLQAKQLPKEMVRVEAGVTFIDHTIILGRRQTIAGVDHALIGMQVGGYRKVRNSPHLAYRDKGIPDLISPDAVLICEIWLRNIVGSSSVEPLPGVT